MKKLILISLMLSLILSALVPATALAAKPQSFHTDGVISGIEDTVIGDNAFPAGNSGRWRVIDRQIEGELLSGDITGSFLMNYKANIELATQAGNLHGTLETNEYSFKINGKIQPLEMVPIAPEVYLPKLTFNGHWTLVDGAQGQGEFNGWVIFIPDEYGHVVSIIASSFIMHGKWQP
ncbi:MAG: hypothetical protein A2144_14295 [Chloroflexi bacterium RBG_16_50_9]|nr:MAG: hypothetical protein A2144_14295 [Chloroflexi bacterium RBG_16_50_9]